MRPIGAWRQTALVAAALGLALAPAPARSGLPAPEPQAHGVYPDESVTAGDALVRVGELAASGNTSEALRVVQGLLDGEGERLLASPADRDVYIPVRDVVHARLLADRALLDAYRAQEGPKADERLALGELGEVERTRFLTVAGFEAALRLAQTHLESARFEAARLVLEGLSAHPDADDPARARDAAGLAGEVARYLARPEVHAWAREWARRAGTSLATPPAMGLTPRPPARTPQDPGPRPAMPEPGALPLQVFDFDRDPAAERTPTKPWVWPSVLGETIYVNTGARVSALDAATLAVRWHATPATSPVRRGDEQEPFFANVGMNSGEPDDASPVAVGGGVALAVGGFPEGGSRRDDRRVHAFDALSGRSLWSVDVSTLDPRLDETIVRGPAVIEGDVAVLALRKANQSRRVSALYLAGVDLYTGRLRWARLVSSVGTNPWSRAASRPEGTTLYRGVVYRTDEMGVVAAYEAWSGRPRWLRVVNAPRALELMQTRMIAQPGAFEMHAPLPDDDGVYVIEPGRGKVLRLAGSNGAITSRRDASALAEPRYLLRVGASIAAVGPAYVAFVPAGDLAQGTVRLGPALPPGGTAGRCLVAGDRLLVPVEGGVWEIDPASPGEPTRHDLPTPGTLLSARAGEGPAHLLTIGPTGAQSYLAWPQARALLEARVAASPEDPAPLLTYVELVHRAGEADRVPDLADRALTLLARSTSAAGASGRSRLFGLLLKMVRASHESPAEGRGAPVITDLALVDAIAQRAGRCADEPDQIASHLFETGWLREAQARPDGAVEAYQGILLDDSLASLRPAWLGADDDGSSVAPTASREATRRLARVLRTHGAAVYEAFDRECDTAALALASPTADDLIRLARRYPGAGATPDLWRRAAELLARAGQTDESRRALGEGLAAGELSAAMGREGAEVVLERLAGAVASAAGSGDAERLYRTLRRLAALRPQLRVASDGAPSNINDVAGTIARRLAQRQGPPRIGAAVLPAGTQVIEGWEPLEPMVRGTRGLSGDSVLLLSDARQQVALWAPSLEDGLMHPLWTRKAAVRPAVVRVGVEQTLLYWPGRSGGTLECVGLDGTTRWRSPELSGVFPPREGGVERFPTPLDGQVRPDDLIFTLDDGVLVLAQRGGSAAGIDLADGRVLWQGPLGASRVYEIVRAGERVVVAGAERTGEAPTRTLTPFVASFDLRTGARVATLRPEMIGDHPRWLRALPDGDAVLATPDSLVRFSPADGAVRWNVRGEHAKGSIGGWVLGEGLLVLDGDVSLWRVDLATGATTGLPIDTRGRLSLPVQATTGDKAVAFASPRGVVMVDAMGKVVGADPLDGHLRLDPPCVGERVVAAIESASGGGVGPDQESYVARVYFFENPGGRALKVERVRLYSSPRSFSLLDGKILIGQGVGGAGLATIVLDVPTQD